MQIFPVRSKSDQSLFLKVPLNIYKNDTAWIQPLDKDIEEVFDEKKNKAFRFGKIERWIVVDEQKNLIGRIAAFVNKKYKNKGDEFAVGGTEGVQVVANVGRAVGLNEVGLPVLLGTTDGGVVGNVVDGRGDGPHVGTFVERGKLDGSNEDGFIVGVKLIGLSDTI